MPTVTSGIFQNSQRWHPMSHHGPQNTPLALSVAHVLLFVTRPPQFDSGLKNDSDNGSIPQDMLPPSDSDGSGSEDDDAGDDTNFEKPSNCYNPNRPQFSDRKNDEDDDDDDDEDDDDDISCQA